MIIDTDDAADFMRFAEVDWLNTATGDRLHSPAGGTFNADYWALDEVEFACGRKVERAWIPGVFTRMGALRCVDCCRATNLPHGIGSPKNDAECRTLLGMA